MVKMLLKRGANPSLVSSQLEQPIGKLLKPPLSARGVDSSVRTSEGGHKREFRLIILKVRGHKLYSRLIAKVLLVVNK